MLVKGGPDVNIDLWRQLALLDINESIDITKIVKWHLYRNVETWVKPLTFLHVVRGTLNMLKIFPMTFLLKYTGGQLIVA